MLDLGGIDIEEIATALAVQTDYEHRWLIDPRTGRVAFWTSDTGIDELDLIPIDPLPPDVWFQNMGRLRRRHQRQRGRPTPDPDPAGTGRLQTV